MVRVGDTQNLQFKLIQIYEVKGLDGDYACSMPEGQKQIPIINL